MGRLEKGSHHRGAPKESGSSHTIKKVGEAVSRSLNISIPGNQEMKKTLQKKGIDEDGIFKISQKYNAMDSAHFSERFRRNGKVFRDISICLKVLYTSRQYYNLGILAIGSILRRSEKALEQRCISNDEHEAIKSFIKDGIAAVKKERQKQKKK